MYGVFCGTLYTDLHTPPSVQPCVGQLTSPLKEHSQLVIGHNDIKNKTRIWALEYDSRQRNHQIPLKLTQPTQVAPSIINKMRKARESQGAWLDKFLTLGRAKPVDREKGWKWSIHIWHPDLSSCLPLPIEWEGCSRCLASLSIPLVVFSSLSPRWEWRTCGLFQRGPWGLAWNKGMMALLSLFLLHCNNSSLSPKGGRTHCWCEHKQPGFTP